MSDLSLWDTIVIVMGEHTELDTLLSVVIPVHNEAENLLVLLPRLHTALVSSRFHFEMVIVDNASTDDSVEVIKDFQKSMPELQLVSEPMLGYGRAVLKGLQSTRGSVLGIMRSDNQEKPEDFCRMVVALQEEKVSFYKAVRMHRLNDGVMRVVVSFVYNTLFKVFFGLKSKDLNATPKIFTREFLETSHLESIDWFIDAEMVIKAEKLGFTLREMNIEYLPRLKGKSSVRARHVFEFLGNMLKWHVRLIHGRLLEK